MILVKGFMQKPARHIIPALIVFVALWSFAACSQDDDTPATPPAVKGEMTLGVSFGMPTKAPAAAGYDDGEMYENYIDIAGGNYRIYFFDTSNKLIARFEPSGFVVTEGSNYRQYNVLGKAPAALAKHSDFKMVVLANWPQYNDALTVGTTTIDDICSAEWAQFAAMTNFEAGPGNLLPFYGVHEYTGVTFEPDVATMLSEPVTLLRAVAKVEVILETDSHLDQELSSVNICRYNAKGYCAPTGVYSQSDYGQGKDWTTDYLGSLHLVGGHNDVDADGKKLPLRKVGRWSESSGKIYEKWIAYLPEYQNTKDDFASIKLRFKGQTDLEEDYSVFFARYEGGTTSNAVDTRLDIQRNNLYRFTINRDPLLLSMKVEEWLPGGKVHIDM